MIYYVKKHRMVFIVAALFLIGVIVIYHNQKGENILHDIHDPVEASLITAEEELEQKDNSAETAEDNEQLDIAVDIKGAVSDPGVYTLKHSARVYDAIELAGGFTKNADQKQINLAERVQDEMLIYVPVEGEVEVAVPQLPGSNSKTENNGISVNTATAEELQTLNGIGPQKAEAILQYIEENGPLSETDDLLQVSGIGEKTLEKFREQIILP